MESGVNFTKENLQRIIDSNIWYDYEDMFPNHDEFKKEMDTFNEEAEITEEKSRNFTADVEPLSKVIAMNALIQDLAYALLYEREKYSKPLEDLRRDLICAQRNIEELLKIQFDENEYDND